MWSCLKILFLIFSVSSSFANSFDIENYKNNQADIEEYRKSLASQLKKTKRVKTKNAILSQAAMYLEEMLIEQIFPAWYGTPWDFNGTSDKPQEGSVACGYFVAATLIDIGINVQRAPLSQQPSSLIIKTFNQDSSYREIGTELNDFLVNLEDKMGEGLYIIGLDNHVGYLHIRNGKRRFIHSNFIIGMREVLSQDLDQVVTVMSFSNWKQAGKLFSNDMILKWLENKEFSVFKLKQ